jgi:hypothetical protein
MALPHKATRIFYLLEARGGKNGTMYFGEQPTSTFAIALALMSEGGAFTWRVNLNSRSWMLGRAIKASASWSGREKQRKAKDGEPRCGSTGRDTGQ